MVEEAVLAAIYACRRIAHGAGAVRRGGFMSQQLNEQFLSFLLVFAQIVILCLQDSIEDSCQYRYGWSDLATLPGSFGVWICRRSISIIVWIWGPCTLFRWGGGPGSCLWCQRYLHRNVHYSRASSSMSSRCLEDSRLCSRGSLSELPHGPQVS